MTITIFIIILLLLSLLLRVLRLLQFEILIVELIGIGRYVEGFNGVLIIFGLGNISFNFGGF